MYIPYISAQITVSSILAIASGDSMSSYAQYHTKLNSVLQTFGGKCCQTVVFMRAHVKPKSYMKLSIQPLLALKPASFILLISFTCMAIVCCVTLGYFSLCRMTQSARLYFLYHNWAVFYVNPFHFCLLHYCSFLSVCNFFCLLHWCICFSSGMLHSSFLHIQLANSPSICNFNHTICILAMKKLVMQSPRQPVLALRSTTNKVLAYR